MRSRAGIVIAVCVAAIACGRSSPPTAPAQTAVDISGNWEGPIASARDGSGTLVLILTQQCLVLLPPGGGCQGQVSGKWTLLFPNPANVDSGTVMGTVHDSTATLSLLHRDLNICPFLVTATATRTAINGKFGLQSCTATMTMPPADSGTVAVTKVEGAAVR